MLQRRCETKRRGQAAQTETQMERQMQVEIACETYGFVIEVLGIV